MNDTAGPEPEENRVPSDGVLGGQWWTDFDAGTAHWDDALCRSFGLPSGSIRHRDDFYALIHPDDRERVAFESSNARRQGHPYAVRFRVVSDDGRVRQAIAWGEQLPDRPVFRGAMYVITSAADAALVVETDRLRSLVSTLEASERRYRLLFQHAPMGMVAIGLDGHVLHPNEAFSELVGFTEAELTGRHISTFFDPEEAAAMRAESRQLIRGELEVVHTERELRCADGSRKTLEIRTMCEREPDGPISHFVSMLEDVSDRRAHDAEMRRLALRDPLTGLANRTCLHDRLDHAFSVASRSGAHVSVLFLDIDRFKSINDDFGHAVGDAVLVEVAGRLRQVARASDTVARVSGDELVIVCPNTDAVMAEIFAERVRAAFEQPILAGDTTVVVSLSIGVAESSSDGDPIQLLDEADEAMYEAKRNGRDRAEVFDSELRRRRQRRIDLQVGLRHALGDGELVFHYQPQVDLRTGELTGVESLIRWYHPIEGVLPACDFIGAAASAGLLPDIGHLAIRSAAEQAAAWRCGTDDAVVPAITVNVAPAQMVGRSLVTSLSEALEISGAATAGLRLEITEDAFMTDLEHARNLLREVNRMGISSGIDDFGTGFSALAYLHRLPLQFLKLDGSFVADMRADAASPLVANVIRLARALDLRVIAECVESEYQRATLAELGADSGQGHLWAPAMAPAALESWLDDRDHLLVDQAPARH